MHTKIKLKWILDYIKWKDNSVVYFVCLDESAMTKCLINWRWEWAESLERMIILKKRKKEEESYVCSRVNFEVMSKGQSVTDH